MELNLGAAPNAGDLIKDVSEQDFMAEVIEASMETCLLYTSPSPRDLSTSRMPSSA